VKEKIATAEATLKKTGPVAARVRTARDYIASSTEYTSCLADLTALFPNEEAVWAMKLSLSTDAKSEMKGELSYRASQANVAGRLLKQMREHRNFTDIWQKAIDTDKKTGDVTYALSFTYKVGGNATQPAKQVLADPGRVSARSEVPTTQAAETNPAATKPAATNAATTKAAETQAVAATMAESRPVETGPAATKPAERGVGGE
jgi:hypothetical protein